MLQLPYIFSYNIWTVDILKYIIAGLIKNIQGS